MPWTQALDLLVVTAQRCVSTSVGQSQHGSHQPQQQPRQRQRELPPGVARALHSALLTCRKAGLRLTQHLEAGGPQLLALDPVRVATAAVCAFPGRLSAALLELQVPAATPTPAPGVPLEAAGAGSSRSSFGAQAGTGAAGRPEGAALAKASPLSWQQQAEQPEGAGRDAPGGPYQVAEVAEEEAEGEVAEEASEVEEEGEYGGQGELQRLGGGSMQPVPIYGSIPAYLETIDEEEEPVSSMAVSITSGGLSGLTPRTQHHHHNQHHQQQQQQTPPSTAGRSVAEDDEVEEGEGHEATAAASAAALPAVLAADSAAAFVFGHKSPIEALAAEEQPATASPATPEPGPIPPAQRLQLAAVPRALLSCAVHLTLPSAWALFARLLVGLSHLEREAAVGSAPASPEAHTATSVAGPSGQQLQVLHWRAAAREASDGLWPVVHTLVRDYDAVGTWPAALFGLPGDPEAALSTAAAQLPSAAAEGLAEAAAAGEAAAAPAVVNELVRQPEDEVAGADGREQQQLEQQESALPAERSTIRAVDGEEQPPPHEAAAEAAEPGPHAGGSHHAAGGSHDAAGGPLMQLQQRHQPGCSDAAAASPAGPASPDDDAQQQLEQQRQEQQQRDGSGAAAAGGGASPAAGKPVAAAARHAPEWVEALGLLTTVAGMSASWVAVSGQASSLVPAPSGNDAATAAELLASFMRGGVDTHLPREAGWAEAAGPLVLPYEAAAAALGLGRGWQAGCGNAGCTNLAGACDAALPLHAACRACGSVCYCSVECLEADACGAGQHRRQCRALARGALGPLGRSGPLGGAGAGAGATALPAAAPRERRRP